MVAGVVQARLSFILSAILQHGIPALTYQT